MNRQAGEYRQAKRMFFPNHPFKPLAQEEQVATPPRLQNHLQQ